MPSPPPCVPAPGMLRGGSHPPDGGHDAADDVDLVAGDLVVGVHSRSPNRVGPGLRAERAPVRALRSGSHPPDGGHDAADDVELVAGDLVVGVVVPVDRLDGEAGRIAVRDVLDLLDDDADPPGLSTPASGSSFRDASDRAGAAVSPARDRVAGDQGRGPAAPWRSIFAHRSLLRRRTSLWNSS